MPYKDPDKQREYQRKWVQNRRLAFFEGKCCQACGTLYGLQLDHIEPNKKIDHRIWTWSERRRNTEIAKCQILCSRCHQDKTSLDNGFLIPGLNHGSAGYRRGCRCDVCKQGHAETNRRSKMNRKILPR